MGNLVWTVLNTISKIGGRQATSRMAGVLWKTATGKRAPENPMSPDTTWGEAAAWAALTGILSGLTVMVVTRQAAKFYTKSAGHLPQKLQAGQTS